MKGGFVGILHDQFLDLIFTHRADLSYGINLHHSKAIFLKCIARYNTFEWKNYKIIERELFESFLKQSFGLKAEKYSTIKH